MSERAREGRAGERKKQRAGRPARERPPGKGRVGGGVSITGPAGFFRAERRYLFGRRHRVGFQPGSCPVTAFAGRCCEVEGPVGRGGPRAGADRPVSFRCDVRAPGGPEGPAGARPPPPGGGLPSGKQWENTSGWTTEQRHSRRRTVNRPRARARILVEFARPPVGSDPRSANKQPFFFPPLVHRRVPPVRAEVEPEGELPGVHPRGVERGHPPTPARPARASPGQSLGVSG